MLKNSKFHLVLITLIALIFGWQLFRPGFFSTHDDLQTMRLYQIDKCFSNGQIPCRWAPDMGAGYGQPTFNYYSATPYYLGELFHLAGFSFVDSTKILFLLSLLLAALFSYYFFLEFASPLASLVGAVLYTLVPYRAVDVYVRGALAEVFALALIPLVLFTLIRLLKKPSLINSLFLSTSLLFLLTAHNITSVTSLFLFIPFTIASFFIFKPSIRKLLYLALGLILGLGLASFFILPIALERNLIQTSFLTQGYFDYNVHFVSLKQLFMSFNWGYGPSEPGTNDNISFAVGFVQSLSIFIFPIILLVKRQSKKMVGFGLVFWLVSLATIFMTHNQSSIIWKSLPFLSFVQFPWRFLGIAVLGAAATWVIIIENLSTNRKMFVSMLLIFTIVLNFGYFKFDKYLPSVTDETLLSGDELVRQQLSAVSDYLPVSSKYIPDTIAPTQPWTTDKGVDITNFQKRSNYFSVDVEVYIPKTEITFPITYFPGWIIYDNNNPEPISFTTDNKYGLITLSLPKGRHKIQSFFENTPIRQISNTISFISLFILLTLYIVSKENNEKK